MQRIVVIGASNLARGLAQAVEAARAAAGGPVEAFIADGHGRSFGAASRVLGRTLPGVLESAIWPALEDAGNSNGRPGWALITDVGNDLLFGYPVPTILEWVDLTVDRLQRHDARAALALPPMERLRTLSPRIFLMFRRLFFPASRMTFDDALAGAAELDAGMRRIATARELPIIEPSGDWYGLDPIHIRLPKRGEAWRAFFSVFGDADAAGAISPIRPAVGVKRLAMGENLFVRSRAPEQRWILGVEQRKPQPSVRLRDGSVIGFY